MVQYTVAMMTKVDKKTTVRPRNVFAAYRSSEQNGSRTPHPNQCGCLQGSSQTGCSFCSLRGRLQFCVAVASECHKRVLDQGCSVYNVGATITRLHSEYRCLHTVHHGAPSRPCSVHCVHCKS